jgi:hypothetical protein
MALTLRLKKMIVLNPDFPHGTHVEAKKDDCPKPGLATWHPR